MAQARRLTSIWGVLPPTVGYQVDAVIPSASARTAPGSRYRHDTTGTTAINCVAPNTSAAPVSSAAARTASSMRAVGS